MSMNILDLTHAALAAWMAEQGEPRFRTDQVWQWLWGRQAPGAGGPSFEAMSNVSKDLRQRLAQAFTLDMPATADTAVSEDGTVKLLLRLADGALVETVLIPERDHLTQCLSTQVGCAMGCTFCATGAMGLTRNMTHGEILGQVLAARFRLADQGRDPLELRNLVFMGMGEPLMNLDNLLPALETLGHDKGLNFSSRRVTVSTVGMPEGLARLGASNLASLAVSLHAPDQELRARLMPRAARTPLDQLVRALEDYPLTPRQRITIEYVLLGGVNDSPEQARQLVRLLARVKCKINLIAYNPGPEPGQSPYAAPSPDAVLAFQAALWDKGLTVVLRKSKGSDIAAACGQLRAQALGRGPA